MSVDPEANLWWRSVLENGQSSPYSKFFDIDWDPIKPELKGRVLLPQVGHGRDPVDQRHVDVDHDRVRIELVRLLDCLEAVLGQTDDAQLGLAVDQLA